MLFSIPATLMSGRLTLIPVDMLGLLALAVALSITSLVIYYHAIRLIDISVSQALFGAGAALIPFLGMWIFGEYISFVGISGFFLIVLSGVLTSVDNLKRPRLNKGFFLMILVVLTFYAHLLLEKEVVENIGWANVVFYHEIMFLVPLTFLLLVPKFRKPIIDNYPSFKANIIPFMIYGIFGAVALMTSQYVLGEVPIALKEGIESTQPFFVLMFAWILTKIGLSGAKEEFLRTQITKKMFFFALMLIGLIMLLY